MSAYHTWQPYFFCIGGAGYSLYAYEAGTELPITTYADKGKTASNAWPVVLNDDGSGNGVAIIYIDEADATLDLKNLDDVSVDGYPANWLKPAQQDEVDSIDTRLTTTENTNYAQTLAIEAAQADIVALDGRLDTAETNITDLDGRLDTAEGDITDLKDRLDTAESDIVGLDGRLGTAETNITDLDGRLDTAETNITDLGGRLTTTEGNVTNALSRISALEGTDHEAPTGTSTSFYDPTADILIQLGNGTTAASGYATITFSTAYTSAPYVVASSMNGASYLTACNVYDVTTTGFGVVVGYSDGENGGLGSFGYQWIAIGRKT